MNRLSAKISWILTNIGLILISAGLLQAAELSPSLNDILINPIEDDSLISIIIFVDDDAGRDYAARTSTMPGMTLKERHFNVIENLKAANPAATQNIKNEILGIYPVANIRSYWVAPALVFEIPVSKLDRIAAISGIASIIENGQAELIEPVDETPVSMTAKMATVYSHLTALNIPAVWQKGITGKGRLVCSFDTGVEGTHPALSSKWRGWTTGSEAAFFAPNSTDTIPFDKTGHGTHTMGLMVGSTRIDSFGVAPGAEWITAAVIDQGQTLSRTIEDILLAFQWAMDPDGNSATIDDMPDVILNSWGIPTSLMQPCDQTFYQVIDNVEAAGIVTIFAAGNEGPDAMSLRIPANRASSLLNSFAVGAIDHTTNTIASFSSRGPSSCDTTQIKPEVVAPGVSIYSSTKNSSYVLKSGTSMAAPLIAGMVALFRQYNPDVTVSEIKNAILESCHDLGATGEDNMYGHGLPDADLALQYLPSPPAPDIYISAHYIGGDKIADPGETFDLYMRLEIPSGEIDSVQAELVCFEEGVEIINNRTLFVFQQKNTSAVNLTPFEINFADAFFNGQKIPFKLLITFPYSEEIDTLALEITVGHEPAGNMVTHVTPRLEATVSDIGQIGYGTGSIFPAGESGFTLDQSENLLYEAGIIVGRSAVQLSSSVRDTQAYAYESDFSPLQELATSYPDIDGGFRSYCRMVDTESDLPLPVSISQSMSSYNDSGNDNFIIIKYYLVNNTLTAMNNVYFGFLADFDLDDSGDRVGFDTGSDMVYQTGDGLYTGLLPLTKYNGILSMKNDGGKIGLDRQTKFAYISSEGILIDDTADADFMTIVSFGPFNLASGDSVEVALAMLAARGMDELVSSVNRAIDRYTGFTEVQESQGILPASFVLDQNYPNPFNPTTTIAFELNRTSKVELTIFNTLGQKVRTLYDGVVTTGYHEITWDGRNSGGEEVGSGIYFYRLRCGSSVETKKMMLIK
nr:S8 family serine peptidase [candidate division Zixibacteria bacterium]